MIEILCYSGYICIHIYKYIRYIYITSSLGVFFDVVHFLKSLKLADIPFHRNPLHTYLTVVYFKYITVITCECSDDSKYRSRQVPDEKIKATALKPIG